MPRRRPKQRHAERGQILVIVAGGLIGLLAIAALVLEGGTLILNRRDGQNASDLGALAGARTVKLNYTDGGRTQADVYQSIEDNLDTNNCGVAASAPCVWEAQLRRACDSRTLAPSPTRRAPCPRMRSAYRVGVTRSPGALLGRVIGIQSWDVSTEATAVSAKPPWSPAARCSGRGVRVRDDLGNTQCEAANGSNAVDFQKGQIYDLTDGKDAPGGFGWLHLDRLELRAHARGSASALPTIRRSPWTGSPIRTVTG